MIFCVIQLFLVRAREAIFAAFFILSRSPKLLDGLELGVFRISVSAGRTINSLELDPQWPPPPPHLKENVTFLKKFSFRKKKNSL